MRYWLLILIRLYWLIPKKYKRRCIFKESCSRYVYRIAKEKGFKKGLDGIKKRTHQCQPGYYRINEAEFRLADQSVVPRCLLNENVL